MAPLKPFEPPVAKKPAPHGPRARLLYVEDEDMNWEVTFLHLRDRYDIVRASNSAQAFAQLKSRKFHAILMDIQLKDSDLDGIAITKILRGTHAGPMPAYAHDITMPHIPIIFMTAHASMSRKAELLALGGDEMITKPIDFVLLGLSVSRCLMKNVTLK